MVNGLLFFYFFWILWIIITFFMPKTKDRTVFAVFTLLCLWFANSYIEIGLTVSITYLILLAGLVFLHSKQPSVIYHFICTFTISIGYAAMLLWEANTTIWLVTSREILIPGTIFCLSLFLVNGFYNRLICSLLGVCIGELIFNIMLYFVSFKNIIGDMAFLDIVSMTLILNMILALCTILNKRIHSSISQLTYK